MNKQFNLLAILLALYCLTYFMLSTILYYLSVAQGYGGLGLPFFGGGDDGVGYATQAKNIANDVPARLTSIHALVLGYVLKIFNSENIFLLKIFNFLGNVLLAFTSLIILKKAIKMPNTYSTSAIILISLLLCYPSLILNSNLSLYRDVWICLYYLLCILFFSNIFIRNSHKNILLNIFFLLISMYFLYGYREYALFSFIIGSGIFLFFVYPNKLKSSNKKLFLFTFLIFTFVYTFLRSYTVPIVSMSLLDALMYRQSGLESFSGVSQFNISLDQSNVILFFINYFYSIISNAFGPFPWQITGVATLLVFFSESVLFLFIVRFLFKRKRSFSNIDLLLITYSIVWFMLIGITNDNAGTAARLRMVGWIPMLIVFSKYLALYLISKRTKKSLGTG